MIIKKAASGKRNPDYAGGVPDAERARVPVNCSASDLYGGTTREGT